MCQIACSRADELQSKSIGIPQRLGGDGTQGDGYDTASGLNSRPSSEVSTIWVNIHDPINGPAFKPSPLKPVPRFMRQPKHVNSEFHHENVAASSEGSTLRAFMPTSPTPGVPAASSLATSLKGAASESCEDVSGYTYTGPLTYKNKHVPFVTEEPLQRPSSRLMVLRRRSETHASAYMTPPEYADEDNALNESPRNEVADRNSDSPMAAHLVARLNHLMHQGVTSQSLDCLESSRTLGAGQKTPRRVTSRTGTESKASMSSGSLIGRSRSTRGGRMRSVGSELKKLFTGK